MVSISKQREGDEMRITLGNGQAIDVDPKCAAQGYCPPMNACGCGQAAPQPMTATELAAITEIAGRHLAEYNDRKGLKPGDQGVWDMVQAARMSVDLDALLSIIEKLARP
jgi:hypothetical protein